MRFGYDTELLNRCPELVAGVIWVEELTDAPTPPQIEALLTTAVRATHERFGTPPEIAMSASIAAWRLIYSRFGVKPNRYPCAAEALIRRVVETGDVPRIGALVDLCNAASLRHGIPVAPFDLAAVVGDTLTVRLATGGETWQAHPSAEQEPIPIGEVIYADATNAVLSRRWNWRQSGKGKIEATTRTVVITTEAVHPEAEDAVTGVLADLVAHLPTISRRVDVARLGPTLGWSEQPT